MHVETQIKAAFVRFDGKHVAPLAALAREIDSSQAAALLTHLPGPDEVAASWVIKAMVEAQRWPDARMPDVFACLPVLTDPNALLHILQIVRYAPDAARPHRDVMVRLAGHPKLLVTVWSFDAYCRTATADEAADRAERIRQGFRHRSKAMQARARALAAEFGVDLDTKS